MARTIWKFLIDPVSLEGRLPAGAKILTAREQGEQICVWAEVDPAAPMMTRRFAVYGTGHEMPDNPGAYIGTAMLHGGSLVFHVYEPATH